jgi:serine-type D-Ala-D-Ala carboxypeptidase/endopeptidase
LRPANRYLRSTLSPVLALLLATAACGQAERPLDGGSILDGGADAGSDLPTREQIDALIGPIMDGGWSRGLVIGLIDPTGSEVFGYGETVDGSGKTPDGDTLFEIGSITKTFTSLWMATLAVSGTVQLHDQVQTYLPSQDTVPSYQGQAIELWHLATHTSGLVRDVTNYHPTDPLDPQGNYSPQDLFAFLGGSALVSPPGAVFSYSNVGVGLLGYALSLKAGLSWQTGIQTAIAQPLGLKDTAEILTPDQQARFAQPHGTDLSPVHPFTFTPALEAAGALRSTASDLLKVASAEVGLTATPLAAAMVLTRQVTYPQLPGGVSLGLFLDGDGNFSHEGQTGGFTTHFGFNVAEQRGVVVLSNTTFIYISQLAATLTNLAHGEQPGAVVPPTLVVAPSDLDAYVGSYELSSAFMITITRQGDQLFAQGSGQAPLRVYESEKDIFYFRAVDAQLIFNRNDSGTVISVTLDQNGMQQVGPKI